MAKQTMNERVTSILRQANRSKSGRTSYEIASKIGATEDSTRRTLTRLRHAGAVDYAGARKCAVTGKELQGYSLAG